MTSAIRLLSLLFFCWLSAPLCGQLPAAFSVLPPQVQSFSIPAPRVPPDTISFQDPLIVCELVATGLPLLITDFMAERTSPTAVLLNWELEESPTPITWTLERRLAPAGDFQPVTELTSEQVLRRRYIDANAFPGTSYYRMRGRSWEVADLFTDVRSVGNTTPGGEILPFPNPTTGGEVSVRLPAGAASGTLDILDGRGRRVKAVFWDGQNGNLTTFMVGQLPPGLYFLRWAGQDGGKAAGRLVVTE